MVFVLKAVNFYFNTCTSSTHTQYTPGQYDDSIYIQIVHVYTATIQDVMRIITT